MRRAAGWIVAAACAISPPPAAAAQLAPGALISVCQSGEVAERAKCEAFVRGAMERLGVLADTMHQSCRATGFDRGDIDKVLNFAKADPVPESGEAIAMVFNYWGSDPHNVPCGAAPGNWAVSRLQALCEADMSGASTCKFYILAVTQMAQIEEVAGGTRYFCPKGNTLISDEEALGDIQHWVAAEPLRGRLPAAFGYIEALKSANPCK